MAEIDAYELWDSVYETQDYGHFEAERHFVVPADLRLSLREDVAPGTLYPGWGGLNAPRVWRRRMFPDRGMAGRYRIVAYYRPPRWRQPDSTQEIRGVLLVDIQTDSARLRREPVGSHRVIEGPPDNAADAKAGKFWKVISGDNNVPIPRTQFRIQALATTLPVSTLEAFVNRVNSNTIFGGAGPAGTVLFLGCHARAPLAEDSGSLWEVELVFLKDPNGWNSSVEVQQFRRRPIKTQVYDETGTIVAGEFRTVTVEEPIEGTQATRTIRGTADFSWFQNVLDL